LLRLPDGTYADVTATCGIPPTGTPLFPIRDSTGDGKPDMIIGYLPTATAGLYQQTPSADLSLGVPNVSFQLKRVDAAPLSSTLDVWANVYATSMSYLPELRWFDFDKDGDEDLLISTRRLGNVKIFERRGNDLKRVLTASHADADGWSICDLNGDTMPDLVTFGAQSHGDVSVRFHLNTSPLVPDVPDDPDDPPPPPPPPPPATTSRCASG
jgi:hypothetical protein